jgi:hypothetical protein
MTFQVREFKAKYIGGHSQITKKRKVTIRLTQRAFVIPEMSLSIDYGNIGYVNKVKEASLRKRGIFQYVDYFGIIFMVIVYAGMMIYTSRKKCLQVSYRDERGMEELLNFSVRNLDDVHASILDHVIAGKQASSEPTRTTQAPAYAEKQRPAPTVLISNNNRTPRPTVQRPTPQATPQPPPQARDQPVKGLEPGRSYSVKEIKEYLSELSRLLETGKISKNEYARMSQPTFTAHDGKKWRIGKDTGKWYVYDGTRWGFGEPPGSLRKS